MSIAPLGCPLSDTLHLGILGIRSARYVDPQDVQLAILSCHRETVGVLDPTHGRDRCIHSIGQSRFCRDTSFESSSIPYEDLRILGSRSEEELVR